MLGISEFTKGCPVSALGKQDQPHTFAKSELFNSRMCCLQSWRDPQPQPTHSSFLRALSSPWSHFAFIAVLCRERWFSLYLQMGNLRLREVKGYEEDHTAWMLMSGAWAYARYSHSKSSALAMPSIREVLARLSSLLTGKSRQVSTLLGRRRAYWGRVLLLDVAASS